MLACSLSKPGHSVGGLPVHHQSPRGPTSSSSTEGPVMVEAALARSGRMFRDGLRHAPVSTRWAVAIVLLCRRPAGAGSGSLGLAWQAARPPFSADDELKTNPSRKLHASGCWALEGRYACVRRARGSVTAAGCAATGCVVAPEAPPPAGCRARDQVARRVMVVSERGCWPSSRVRQRVALMWLWQPAQGGQSIPPRSPRGEM